MTGTRWEQVKDLLHRAMQMAPDRRGPFLDGACGSDATLRAEIESLLSSNEGISNSFLHSTPLGVGGASLAAGELFAQRFRLLRKLGEGGMGQVWLAEQISPVRRQVAVKLIRAGMYDESVVQRFESERQSLAIMDHPCIAKVFDAGTTVHGQPYFVMEYVPGLPITEYCDQHKLSVRNRLELFIQACKGVQHAHQKSVIHRDLKPANILVVDVDDNPVPRIIDFGLAKASTPRALDQGLFTQIGQFVGTPGFMSPEQADPNVQDIDTRTDVYSLGAVLYVLLTGVQPFAGSNGLKPPIGELLRKLREEEPPPPSSQVSANLESSAAIARARGSDTRRLISLLRGDLDWITLKALEKDRSRRYKTPAELAADLQRHVNDESVVARPAGAAYRLRKYCRRHRSRTGLVIAAVLLVLASIVFAHLNYHHAPRLTDKDTVVLADFANSTGDPVFDETLKTGLGVSLQQSPFLNLLSDSRVEDALLQMTRPAGTKLAPEVAREVCQRTGGKAYIAGAISRLGSQYVVSLKAVTCQSGDTLVQEQATADTKELVLDVLGEVASKIRAELGESLASVQKFDVPLEQATTPSLEALKAYSLGSILINENGPLAEALAYHQRSVALDPNFALGYRSVGVAYLNLGEVARANDFLTKAFQLRDHASDRERLAIEGDYYRHVTGELEKAAQAYQEQIDNHPREFAPYGRLADVFAAQGQYARAAAVAEQADQLAPDNAVLLGNQINYTMASQRLEEAGRLIQRVLIKNRDTADVHSAAYALAFLRSDSAAMTEHQQWFAGHPDFEGWGLALAADTNAYLGHLRDAKNVTERAVESAVRADNKEGGAIYLADAALEHAAFGNAPEARRFANEALQLAADSPAVKAEAALAFAMAHDPARAVPLAQDLDLHFPRNIQMQSLWLAAIRAHVALDAHRTNDALNLLHGASAADLGLIEFANNISCLYPIYVRGQAYLAAGRGADAAAEFQRIIDHSGIVWNCWTGALARLGRARANALESRNTQASNFRAARDRALAGYADFLTLWKDADPDVTVLIEARTEYAKLQASRQP